MTFTGSGFERMRNIPVTTVLMTVFIFLSDIKNRTKYLLLIFWAGIIVLSQHRGLMISLIVAIPLCLFLKKSYKKVFNIISMFLVAGIAFSPIIIWRFSQQGSGESSLTKEISEGLNMRSSKNAEVDGTFTFRTFMILERIEWMEGHPMNLLFGNGTIHEDSKKTASKFNFTIGYAKADEFGSYSIKQQIETTDVAFLTFFMRFGVLGLVLLIVLLAILYKRYTKCSGMASYIGLALFLYSVLRILSGDEFTAVQYIILFSCATMCKRLYYRKNKIIV